MTFLLLAAALAVATTDDEGFDVLFDGRSAEGWKQAGPGGFAVHDGVATSHGGMGLWYFEKKKFKNYILKLEYRQHSERTNSGVFIRFPRVENDPWIPVEEGYEIQICDEGDAKHRTGAITSFKESDEVASKPVGQWNHYEIHVAGRQVTVRLNGRKVTEFTGDRGLEGFVGLQNHDDGSRVSFRNVRVVALAPAKKK